MKHLFQTTQFAKDVKRMAERGKDLGKLEEVVRQLVVGRPLNPKYRDHPLSGRWSRSRDCHIEGDWVLLYTTDKEMLRLERTGTHSDLFD